jgi:hypothetical protein
VICKLASIEPCVLFLTVIPLFRLTFVVISDIQTVTYIRVCRIKPLTYKVVQIWLGWFVCKQVTVCPGHIWTTLYVRDSLYITFMNNHCWNDRCCSVPYIQQHFCISLLRYSCSVLCSNCPYYQLETELRCCSTSLLLAFCIHLVQTFTVWEKECVSTVCVHLAISILIYLEVLLFCLQRTFQSTLHLFL